MEDYGGSLVMTTTFVEAVKARNYRSIRELIIMAYTTGMNVLSAPRWILLTNVFNVVLVVSSAVSLYGHWCHAVHYLHDIPNMTEAVCTACQALISIVKLLHFLPNQLRYSYLLKQALGHDLLQECEIFQHDFPINEGLKQKINDIVAIQWRSSRRQLIIYLILCVLIMSNYCITAYAVNFYHSYIGTPDYHVTLPYPAFYPAWESKGMSFPYYHIEMYLGTCAVWISGSCAVSYDCLFVILCRHSVALMRALMEMVRNSTSELLPKARRVEYLRCCIYQYQRIMIYASELRQLYQQVMLPQFLMSLIIWGLILFEMGVGIESNKIILIRMVMYIMAAGYQVIIYCYNGQQFANASEELPGTFYNCAWYEENREFRKLIHMMLIRTNRLAVLDVSWFTTMTLPTLMTMVRQSFSYFLLLRNLTSK